MLAIRKAPFQPPTALRIPGRPCERQVWLYAQKAGRVEASPPLIPYTTEERIKIVYDRARGE